MRVNKQRQHEQEGRGGAQDIAGPEDAMPVHMVHKDASGRAKEDCREAKADNGNADERRRAGNLVD